ncbi:hypothetical protein [Vibrio sp. SCSIO 43136]|uniref:hypothetical protein n=1 Tax=Vibrio sp. SCSIO 43136 TaxID=2819101 RepID=UPI0020756000|nr:hypothetical protein [Vibrio sp. SCSIO 43136]USD64668.1 hypothetical protein J4N39_11335 [Vibrio sp. SCSIO 43136]
MRTSILLLSTLFLFACGGGSPSPKPEPKPVKLNGEVSYRLSQSNIASTGMVGIVEVKNNEQNNEQLVVVQQNGETSPLEVKQSAKSVTSGQDISESQLEKRNVTIYQIQRLNNEFSYVSARVPNQIYTDGKLIIDNAFDEGYILENKSGEAWIFWSSAPSKGIKFRPRVLSGKGNIDFILPDSERNSSDAILVVGSFEDDDISEYKDAVVKLNLPKGSTGVQIEELTPLKDGDHISDNSVFYNGKFVSYQLNGQKKFLIDEETKYHVGMEALQKVNSLFLLDNIFVGRSDEKQSAEIFTSNAHWNEQIDHSNLKDVVFAQNIEETEILIDKQCNVFTKNQTRLDSLFIAQYSAVDTLNNERNYFLNTDKFFYCVNRGEYVVLDKGLKSVNSNALPYKLDVETEKTINITPNGIISFRQNGPSARDFIHVLINTHNVNEIIETRIIDQDQRSVIDLIRIK